jgi:hypothetical protein
MTLLSRLHRLERKVAIAARRHDVSRVAIACRLLRLFWQLELGFGDALELGFADPGVSRAVLEAFFTKHGLVALQDRLNPRALEVLTEDKSIFYPFCAALGVPVPETHALFAAAGGWRRGGVPVQEQSEWIRFFEEELPEAFVCKPARGAHGRGISAWSRAGDGFVDHSGRRCNAAELYALLAANSSPDPIVIQERLENHPELVRWSACTALQTVRVATLIDSSGAAQILYAEWKLILAAGVVDNLRDGTSGNLTANASIQTGVLAAAGRRREDGTGLEPVTHHPVTGVAIQGAALPDWEALRGLALRCARLFRPLRTIGWDIALTPKGPVVVEGNRWWDPPNDALLAPLPLGVSRHDMVEGARKLRSEDRLKKTPGSAPGVVGLEVPRFRGSS